LSYKEVQIHKKKQYKPTLFFFHFKALNFVEKNMIYLQIISILLAVTLGGKGDNPPGTKMISEGFYSDITEVRNIDWREYVYWEKRVNGDTSEQYLNSLPDSSYWKYPGLSFNEYYAQPKYNNCPVVCISYAQAVSYCQWRSDRVNENYYRKKNKIQYTTQIDYSKVIIPVVVTYRLPSPAEWEKLAALDGTAKSVFSSQGNYGQAVCSMKSDASGLCDMAGNVSEMTSMQGIAKGCSFTNKAEEFNIKTDFTYNKPTFWLGFRCVCDKTK
jgi:formylglycine-generating enzyme required for sulfatase activity